MSYKYLFSPLRQKKTNDYFLIHQRTLLTFLISLLQLLFILRSMFQILSRKLTNQ